MIDKERSFAIRWRDYLKGHDTVDVRELIVDNILVTDDLDTWFDVFRCDADMLKRFEDNKHRIWPREPLLVDLIA